uniref:Uncharacterized protein n=1 Tax=Peronospora matthiolae TaxID=2874970 RepID=A0AAV1U8B3_9STRA
MTGWKSSWVGGCGVVVPVGDGGYRFVLGGTGIGVMVVGGGLAGTVVERAGVDRREKGG